MALRGVPLAPGRGAGPAQIVDDGDADAWHRGREGRIAVARGADWPPTALRPPAVLGAVLERRPPGPPPVGPFPIVGGIDADLFVAGERVTVDGDRGAVEIAGVAETAVVTAFLERDDGRILLLRRSAKVGSFRGHWAAVSGYLEDPTPEGQAVREIREETGIASTSLALRSTGPVVYARDGARIWAVHPFRFRVDRAEVAIDWEHTEFAWVDPSEIGRRTTVPKLDRAWAAVAESAGERQKG